MAEETNNTPAIDPKMAVQNLFTSMKTPLVWFGIGFVSALLWQARRRKAPGA